MTRDQQIGTAQTTRAIQSSPRRQASRADPCAMTIFGAGGDLTKRLVVPALYNLSGTEILPDNFALIGVGLAEAAAERWRDHLYDFDDDDDQIVVDRGSC